jgi:hypothetical protein
VIRSSSPPWRTRSIFSIDTGLLDLTLLRRDQIWFAEKDEKTMQTDIYALTEFTLIKTLAIFFQNIKFCKPQSRVNF